MFLRTFPLRNYPRDHMGLSLDTKAAHQRICIWEEEHCLLDFTLQKKLYFSRCNPPLFLGVTFFAAWWARLGGWMLRFFHSLIWRAHVALPYVDDFLLYQARSGMPLSAAMIGILCPLTNIPVSWNKCELAFNIQWLSGIIHFRADFTEIPMATIDKFRNYGIL